MRGYNRFIVKPEVDFRNKPAVSDKCKIFDHLFYEFSHDHRPSTVYGTTCHMSSSFCVCQENYALLTALLYWQVSTEWNTDAGLLLEKLILCHIVLFVLFIQIGAVHTLLQRSSAFIKLTWTIRKLSDIIYVVIWKGAV